MTAQESIDATVFKRLLHDYRDCLLAGDHRDASAAFLCVVAEYKNAASRAQPVARTPLDSRQLEGLAIARKAKEVMCNKCKMKVISNCGSASGCPMPNIYAVHGITQEKQG